MKDKKISILNIMSFMLIMLIINSSIGNFSADYYFLVSTGREIIHNGIPHVNPWFVDDGVPFIAQQWVYAIYTYFLDLVGNWSVTLSIIVMQLCLICTMIRYMSIYTKEKNISVLFSVFAVLFGGFYMHSIRPETVTIILLMLQIISLERYKKFGNKLEFLIIVLLNVLESNIHASMCIMHYAILLAYMFPSIKKISSNGAICNKFSEYVKVILFLFVLIASSCINPYGYKVIGYTVSALLSDTFDTVEITEMSAPSISDSIGICVIVHIMAVLVLVFKKRKCDSSTLYTCMGITFCEALAYRNNMFSSIVNILLLKEIILSVDLSHLVQKIESAKKLRYTICLGICTIITISTAVKFVLQMNNVFAIDMLGFDNLDKVQETIESYDISEDTPIFVNMNYTSYFEYKGYSRLYIDARPELYIDRGNSNNSLLSNILMEDRIYFSDGYEYRGDDFVRITDQEIDDLVNYYGFRCFIVVPPNLDRALTEYLERHKDIYNMIYSVDNIQVWIKK